MWKVGDVEPVRVMGAEGDLASRHLRISSGGLPPRRCKGGRSPATCFDAQARKCVAKGCRSIETRREIAARKCPAKGKSIWA